jgi:lambda repressor-like predicted transcriptional regulator
MSNAGSMFQAAEAIVQKGMTPKEIKAALILRGVSIKEIAETAGVTSGAVSQTIYQYRRNGYRGLRIRKFIALALNRRVDEIWPDDSA